jgi:4-hydroxy-3-methylbut-2-enyl diphosphate reductase
VFVEDETEVPPGAVVVFSAHGSPPSAFDRSRALGHELIDATCPLVTKVHNEARRYAAGDMTIVLVGHAGHQEVVGTMGVAPENIRLVETADDVAGLDAVDPAKVAYVTQTTLSVDDTAGIVAKLRERFPLLHGPKRDDICYATQNRQDAVKALSDRVDVLLVVGSASSSNSNRLVEVARQDGVPAHLIDDEGDIDERWLEAADVVGLTSGASAPDVLVDRVVAWFRERGTTRFETVTLVEENVEFAMPANLARALTSRTPERAVS